MKAPISVRALAHSSPHRCRCQAPPLRSFSTASSTPSLAHQRQSTRAPSQQPSFQIPPRPSPIAPQTSLPQTRSFSSSRPSSAKPGQVQRDPRVRNIRYHLSHPLLPRPLRLSRNRALRHWTIHRGWQLFRRQQRTAQELALERQYMSMRDACEALRLIGEDGLAVPREPGERAVRPPGARDPASVSVKVGRDGGEGGTVELDLDKAAHGQKEVGRLYRIAMEKQGIFQGVPIEYARIQTDTPSKSGWDHEWKREMAAPQKR